MSLHKRAHYKERKIIIIITRNATALGERMRVLHRQFYITGVLYVSTEPQGHLVSYSILCPLRLGALSGSKKLKRITVHIQKEPVSWSFVRPN